MCEVRVAASKSTSGAGSRCTKSAQRILYIVPAALRSSGSTELKLAWFLSVYRCTTAWIITSAAIMQNCMLCAGISF